MIFEKMDLMARETGEHPFVFQKEGIPISVNLPAEAENYLSPQEMQLAERIYMEPSSCTSQEEEKQRSLSEKILNAKEKSKNMNPVHREKQQSRKINDKQI